MRWAPFQSPKEVSGNLCRKSRMCLQTLCANLGHQAEMPKYEQKRTGEFKAAKVMAICRSKCPRFDHYVQEFIALKIVKGSQVHV